jgi:hypothetical protein
MEATITLHTIAAMVALIFSIVNTIMVGYKLSEATAVNFYQRSPTRLNGSILADQLQGLAWFVQISDLHFSIFQDNTRATDFQDLCKFVNEAVQPQAVILTGDLTDAKTKDKLGSRQFLEEWNIYHDTMKICGAYGNSNPKWLDVRGNHDTFNINGAMHDYYRDFGIQKDKKSYLSKVNVNNVTYGFVAIDATLNPGPKRPFNFFGSLSTEELEEIDYLMSEAAKSSDVQIVFSHYPTSCTVTPNPGLKSVIGKSPNVLAYLCGHLHTLNGLVPHMYSSQPEGFLELELGDWKDNRIFRILVVDQGHLIFHDAKHVADQAVAVISNPRDITFVQSHDFEAVKTSSHIRVLAFANQALVKVMISIDGSDPAIMKLKSSSKPLYTVNWNPKDFDDGHIHTAQLSLHLEDGQVIVQNPTHFSLSPQFDMMGAGLLANIVLSFNWSLVTQAVFGLCAAGLVIPLCIIRLNPYLLSSKWRLVKGLVRVASNDAIFAPVGIAALYVSFGPWAVGYFLEDHAGLLFPWGLLINGHILPADTTHVYGVFFIFPYLYLLVLAIVLQRRKNVLENSLLYWIKYNIVFVIIMIFQVLHCIEFYLSYGILATLFSVCGLGRIWFVYLLWSRSRMHY